MSANPTDIPTPRLNSFLESRGCGQRGFDYYGDDWSHADIYDFVDEFRTLEREIVRLKTELAMSKEREQSFQRELEEERKESGQ